MFRHGVAIYEIDGWMQLFFTQGMAIVGASEFSFRYSDGNTHTPFVYFITNP